MLNQGSAQYPAVIQGDKLYRKEGDEIGEWSYHGGAVANRDFAVFAQESCPQSPFARTIGHQIEGIGRYAGKGLKEVAQRLEVGHTLIVSSLGSPRAREHNIAIGETACLSGVVASMREVPDTPNLTKLLN